MLAVAMGVAASATAAAKKPAPAPAPLSEQGQKLEQRYTAMLEEARAQVVDALPKVNEQAKAAYLSAREAEAKADDALKAAQEAFGAIARAEGLVNHAKGKWIGGAQKGIADAQAKLAQASTDADRKAAEEELAKWQKNLADGQAALQERQAALDAAKRDEARLKQGVEQAKAALEKARAETLESYARLGVVPFLSSDKLDSKLAKLVVLNDATPRGLAEFAEQGAEQQQLVEKLLADADLMLQMTLNDGASGGKYGQAMEIYTAIQKASPKARDGALQRLALGVALEHAVPIKQDNPKSATNAPQFVDPVKRYQHFEKAFLDGELDPAFDKLSVWDYRMVVNGEEPDETLTWGRQMLRNYRPDHITTPDYHWRYVAAVRTDIRYGSQDVKHDRDDLQSFQNMLMNGGVCGRRAFFGRFILRAFGVPTTARPQPGHAALVHWSPEGWVINLGAGWGSGTTKTRYTNDLDFLATTQARKDLNDYLQVKRAQWVGDAVGEPQVFGIHEKNKPGFWYGVSLHQQQAIIKQNQAKTLAAVGEELGEANESNVKYDVINTEITDADRKIDVSASGVITIPAAATSTPTKTTGKIIFMPSNLGGKQLHYSRGGNAEPFEYTFEAPKAGVYNLTARVVTPSWQQHLSIFANGAKEPVDLDLPFTVGMWETTEPVQVQLVQGKNVLRFEHRASGEAKGFSIRDFTLTPAR